MIPIDFKEANKRLQKPSDMTIENCGSLPIAQTGNLCISCWRMSFKDRLLSLLFGKIWLVVRSGITQPPVKITVEKPFH